MQKKRRARKRSEQLSASSPQHVKRKARNKSSLLFDVPLETWGTVANNWPLGAGCPVSRIAFSVFFAALLALVHLKWSTAWFFLQLGTGRIQGHLVEFQFVRLGERLFGQ